MIFLRSFSRQQLGGISIRPQLDEDMDAQAVRPGENEKMGQQSE